MGGRSVTVCLGIDQSYSGLAMVAYDSETKVWKDSLTAFPADRFVTQSDRLDAVQVSVSLNVRNIENALGRIDVVAMEGYAPGAKFGRELAGELGGAVKLVLLDVLNKPACYPLIVAPTKLKKYTTGKGTAAKAEMLLAVYKKWGVTYADDNLADAYSLARAANTWFTRTGTKTEMDTLKELKRFKGETHLV
jgi:Holliday junction resolvasome RuvABC endonuclease subunit